MTSKSRERFSGLDWFNSASGHDIITIGLGGIGSNLVIPLAKIGENTHYLFDSDVFDEKNMAGQLVTRNDIEKRKVIVARSNIHLYSEGNNVNAYSEHFDKNSTMSNIVFVGTDSISSRKLAFESWYSENKDSKPTEAVFIDGRLAAESFQLFCILPGTKELEWYRDTQLNEDGLTELPCTLKQTQHVAQELAANMVSVFTNWCEGGEFRLIPSYIKQDKADFNRDIKFYAL